MLEIQQQKQAVEERVNKVQPDLHPQVNVELKKPKDSYQGTKDKLLLQEYKMAASVIKETTGISDANDVIHKFATQAETIENLKELKSQHEKKLLMLTDKRQQVKDDLEKMKLEGLEALTRK